MNRLVHWEIPSTDLKRSAGFYAALFGWKMEQLPGDEYVTFSVEEGTGGGISRVGRMPEPCIDVYIGVDDIPVTLKKVEELGGKTLKPKTEIGNNWGYYALFADPCGCRIGIWSEK
ncbi:MAG: VOC family protein [candidate division WOR-3 bacterium]